MLNLYNYKNIKFLLLLLHKKLLCYKRFLKANHRGVITTKQKNGALHSSIIVCGAFKGKAAFVAVRGKSTKVRNLRHNSNCSLLVVTNDWREWINIEGEAQLFDYHNSDPEHTRLLLRDLFNVCGDSEHPNWQEYDNLSLIHI